MRWIDDGSNEGYTGEDPIKELLMSSDAEKVKEEAYKAAVEAAYAGVRYQMDLADSCKMIEDGYWEEYGAEAFLGRENLTSKYHLIWQEKSAEAIRLHERYLELRG